MEHNNHSGDNGLYLSDIEADMLATYEYQLQDMANAVVEQGADIEEQLAALVEHLPDSARTELVRRFRAKVQEMQEAAGMFDELTPEQEQQMELLKSYEQHYIAHMLSEKALDKIRKMLLANPSLMEHIVGMGEELVKKGVFAGKVPPQVLLDSLTTAPQQTPVNTTQQADKDSSRGR